MDDQAEIVELRVAAPRAWDAVSWWRLPLICLAVGVLSYLCLDRASGRYFSQHPVRGDVSNLLSAAEHFGTPYGQLMILLTLLSMQRRRFPQLARTILAATAAGLSADVVKLVIARTRPRAFDFGAHAQADGFTQLFPFGSGGSAIQSFPSAHTASAFGFAALMTWAYPQGRPAFITLAILTGMQRIGAGAHFPSDVCAGAALGWLVGAAFIHWSPLTAWWGRWERRWETSWPRSAAPNCVTGDAESESAPGSKQAA